MGACFKALDESDFTALSDLSLNFFYHPNLAIGKMCVPFLYTLFTLPNDIKSQFFLLRMRKGMCDMN